MAKKTKDTITIKRNGNTKEVSKSQWDAMKKNGATYGWKLSSDLSDEVIQKEKGIEASKITELEGTVKTLTDENETLKASVLVKDSKITELEGTVWTLQEQVNALTPSGEEKAVAKK